MKMIDLTQTTEVNGIMRSHNDGDVPVSDAEAKRLIGEGKAIDVSANYSADQMANIAPHLVGQ